MNTMQRINKLIGDTMRAVRAARGRKREALCRALGWLNKARAYFKRAYEISADYSLRVALGYVKEAAQWA